jgi:hypothetical protein
MHGNKHLSIAKCLMRMPCENTDIRLILGQLTKLSSSTYMQVVD